MSIKMNLDDAEQKISYQDRIMKSYIYFQFLYTYIQGKYHVTQHYHNMT